MQKVKRKRHSQSTMKPHSRNYNTQNKRSKLISLKLKVKLLESARRIENVYIDLGDFKPSSKMRNQICLFWKNISAEKRNTTIEWMT